ncbi:hypothetical protein MNEG_8944 [Monoraphidium neglectum]|uniref:Uncharacterized protein n=1 Tax=Monoraphidium neglectum TaxID=145388 RepID=A0A0D2MXX4_9CHLO|nr:hypothetical protein MNEG_8944 [Monoraphidium neglectum]KIY99020.1 hypothetical protein MNEG_8944 [Monoraphidium neglectum]|eukprot:XP_013898040.1 hypothetical protein MNEG_8944 [Monoraphidium neglectum]
MGACISKDVSDNGAVKTTSSASTAGAAAAKDAAPMATSAQPEPANSCACAKPRCADGAAEHLSLQAEPHDSLKPPLARVYSSSTTPSRSSLRPSMDGGGNAANGCGAAAAAAAGGGLLSGGSLTSRSHSSEGSGPLPRVRFAPGAAASDPRVSGERRRTHELACSDSVSLKKIVDVFYEKVRPRGRGALPAPAARAARVMGDARLSPFFKSVDISKLKSHQVTFMALAFGGKQLVTDEHPALNLRRIHWRLIKDSGLTEQDWEWFFEHFKATLGELPEIPEETKAAAVASVAATRVYFAPITDDEVASGAYALAPAPGGAAAPAADGGGGADACTVAGAAGGDAAAAGVAVV